MIASETSRLGLCHAGESKLGPNSCPGVLLRGDLVVRMRKVLAIPRSGTCGSVLNWYYLPTYLPPHPPTYLPTHQPTYLQLNLNTTATFRTKESGLCREV